MIELLNVLKFVVIIFISLSYFKSQNYMKIIRKNLIGIANLHISTIFLLKANSVVITDRERDVEVERMSRYFLNEVETSHHLISIRLYFILTILITEDDHNHFFLLKDFIKPNHTVYM
jgi:hypothetical protein